MILQNFCEGTGIDYKEEYYEKLMTYMNLVIEWNQKINLTAIVQEEEFFIKHFLDSISVFKFNKLLNSNKIADIGTGAGFPGIPMAILSPSINYTLVDSLNKRINFLGIVKEKLELSNIELIHSRAEDLAMNPNYRAKYDAVVSRAVANLPVLCEYSLPFIKKGGYFVALKGPNVVDEIPNGREAMRILGGQLEKVEEVNLNEEIKSHKLVIIKKIKDTPGIYPRKPAIISKNPL